jgi:hypothetical protein
MIDDLSLSNRQLAINNRQCNDPLIADGQLMIDDLSLSIGSWQSTIGNATIPSLPMGQLMIDDLSLSNRQLAINNRQCNHPTLWKIDHSTYP